MNDPILLYLKILGASVLVAMVWLAASKQKAALTAKAVWIGFCWRALPSVIILCIGVFEHHPVLAFLALLLLTLKIVVLIRLLRFSGGRR